MIKKLLPFFISILSISSFAEDYYSESVYSISDDGDTLTIKPYNYEGPVNSVYYAIMYDTASDGSRNNEDRVYKTMRGGVYIYNEPAVIDASVPNLKIVADDYDDDHQPPLHIKVSADDGSTNRAFFNYYGNFYAQNQYFYLAYAATSTRDRLGFNALSTDQTMEMDNCIFEISDWTVFSNWVRGISFKFTNCKFLNIGREASIEKGVTIDGGSSIRKLYLENNTFLNCGFVVWTREAAGIGDFYVNHNTFVNMTQNPFQTFTQAKEIVTNNLFINTGLAPDYPGYYTSMEDDDALPRGIINIDTVENIMKEDYWYFDYPVDDEASRAILVDRNNAWWDSKFTDMFENDLEDCSSYYAGGWMDQKITMNTRTQAMFDDNASYPLLTEGIWYSAEPDFTNNKDLIDDWVEYIATNVKANPEEVNTGVKMPNWRTKIDTFITNIDWPILADLSYTTSDLINGALNSYPLGDLNWFPDIKDEWEGTNEYEVLIACRDSASVPGTSIFAATLTKHGIGSSSQTVFVGDSITGFYYSYGKADTVNVTGMPEGIITTVDVNDSTVSFSGFPTDTGSFTFSVRTVGNNVNVSQNGTITVITKDTATLIKNGAGSSSQTVTLGDSIIDFSYTWTNATTVTVAGIPEGINATIYTTEQEITINGVPTSVGVFNYTITTVGADVNTSIDGTITVLEDSSVIKGDDTTSAILNNKIGAATPEIYPNPSVNGSFSIKFNQQFNGTCKIQVYNIQGAAIYSDNFMYNENEVNINTDLSSGIYYIQINNSVGNYTKKLIVE